MVNKNTIGEYVPFGEEWTKEMMKATKYVLVSFVKSANQRRIRVEELNAELLEVAELQEVFDETEGFYYNATWYQKGAAARKLAELRKAAIAKAKGGTAS